MFAFSSILIAEDDEDDFNLFAEALETIDPAIQLIRVKNGLECLNKLKERSSLIC